MPWDFQTYIYFTFSKKCGYKYNLTYRRVLQTSPESPLSSPTNNPKLSLGTTVTNRKIVCKRRASIATISQQIPENQATTDMKKVLRRTSDLSMRASSLTRNGRPTRLEYVKYCLNKFLCTTRLNPKQLYLSPESYHLVIKMHFIV